MLAALLSCEEPTVPNEQEAEFAAYLVWILCRSKSLLSLPEIKLWMLGCEAYSLITMPIELSQLPYMTENNAVPKLWL
jgi:hypothetical protein